MPGGCGRTDKEASCCDGDVCGDDCCATGYECQLSGIGRYQTKQCVLSCAARTRRFSYCETLLHVPSRMFTHTPVVSCLASPLQCFKAQMDTVTLKTRQPQRSALLLLILGLMMRRYRDRIIEMRQRRRCKVLRCRPVHHARRLRPA